MNRSVAGIILFSFILLTVIALTAIAGSAQTQQSVTPHDTPNATQQQNEPGEPIDLSMLPAPPPVAEPDKQYGNTDRSAMIGEKLTEVSNNSLIKTVSIDENPDNILVKVHLKNDSNPYDLIKPMGNLTSSVDFYYSLIDDKQSRNISLKVNDSSGKTIIDAVFSNKDYAFIYYNVLDTHVLDTLGTNTSSTTPTQTKHNRKLMTLQTGSGSFAQPAASGTPLLPGTGTRALPVQPPYPTPYTQPNIPAPGRTYPIPIIPTYQPPYPTMYPSMPVPAKTYSQVYTPTYNPVNLTQIPVQPGGTLKPLPKNLYPELPMKKVPKAQYGNTSRSAMIAEKLSIENGGKIGIHINENDGLILVDMHFKYYDIDRILAASAETVYYINWVYRMIGLGNSDITLKIYGPNGKQIANATFSCSKNAFENFYMTSAHETPTQSTESTIPQHGGMLSNRKTGGNYTPSLNNTQNVVINYW
ncbi:MAG TPA: hypothetical protein VK436_11190 [Methanocella sp.]|nr:hypothetical protein [Methanocella sp.]